MITEALRTKLSSPPAIELWRTLAEKFKMPMGGTLDAWQVFMQPYNNNCDHITAIHVQDIVQIPMPDLNTVVIDIPIAVRVRNTSTFKPPGRVYLQTRFWPDVSMLTLKHKPPRPNTVMAMDAEGVFTIPHYGHGADYVEPVAVTVCEHIRHTHVYCCDNGAIVMW